ncbi:hypothetical protein ACFPET_11745 [Salininema proteolyticum]|uniref:Uncharacterized protein n=2 Tax=Salininema proteolyticum TaxID=1607685 RepID=A0ABV8TZ77_9ACTN
MSSDFGQLAEYAKDEEGDVQVFGLIGMPLATQYFDSAEKVQELIKKMEPAGEGLGRLIGNSCSRYENADSQGAQGIGQAGSELSA